jgi:UDP-glucose 4-epimerase
LADDRERQPAVVTAIRTDLVTGLYDAAEALREALERAWRESRRRLAVTVHGTTAVERLFKRYGLRDQARLLRSEGSTRANMDKSRPLSMRVDKMRVERLVVLGHSGFIGTRLYKRLAEQHAGADIIGLSMGSIDLTASSAVVSLADVLGGSTTLLVLAGIKKQMGDNLEICERNLAMAAAVCRAIKAKPVRRVLFFSSADVYGETTDEIAVTERTPVRPTSYYGIAKFASEGLFRKTVDGIPLMILRPPLVYGPGEPAASYGPTAFARSAVRGEPITLWGDGTERRDFLYVDDLVDITCELAASNVSGVVNVATGRSSTFRDVIDGLERILGTPVAVASRPRTRPSVDQGYVNARLARLLPEMRFTSLDEGLERLVAAERTALESAGHA